MQPALELGAQRDGSTPRDASSSAIIRPILRVGLSALIAYCGMSETSVNR